MRAKAFTALALAALCLLSGCDSVVPQDKTNDERGDVVQISPIAQDAKSGKRNLTLYFIRDLNEALFIPETRALDIPSNSTPEEVAILELLKGPSPERETQRCIASNVRLINIAPKEDVLVVTLSENVLDLPPEAPVDWNTNTGWRNRVYTQRRLAFDSIVNTVTELGNYNAVQFFIGEGENRVPLTYEALDYGASGDTLAFERTPHQILTVSTAIDKVFECLGDDKNYETLFSKYLASVDDEGNAPPSNDQMLSQLSKYTIIKIDIKLDRDITISNDGQTATVWLQYSFTPQDGGDPLMRRRALRMRREAEIWKITWPSLASITA